MNFDSDIDKVEKNEFWFYISLFLIGIIILFLRSSYNIITPYMYTEDGEWISSIINKGLINTLIFSKSGYFVFGNIILLEICNLLNKLMFGDNLVNLPYFVTCASYCFYSFVALMPVIFLKQVLRKEARIFIWIFILLIPLGVSASEVLGKISNVGYSFYFIALCLLIYRGINSNSLKKYKLIFIDVLIFICCTTNPVCYPITGIAFFIEVYRFYKLNSLKFSEPKNCFFTLIKSFEIRSYVVLGIVLALSVLFKPSGKIVYFTEPIVYKEIIEFFCRNLLFNFVFPIYSYMNDTITIVVLVSFAIYFFIALKVLDKNDKYLLIISIVALIFFTITTLIVRRGLTYNLKNYTSPFPDRYFVVQNMLVLIPIGICFSGSLKCKKSIFKYFTYSLVIIMGLIYVFNIRSIFELNTPLLKLNEKTFKQRVHESFNNNNIIIEPDLKYIVDIDFEGWTMIFPKENMYASIIEERNVETTEELNALNLTDINWTNGIFNHGNVILVANNKLNRAILKDVEKLNVGNEYINVSQVLEINNDFIHIVLDEKVERESIKSFEYPNTINVLKKYVRKVKLDKNILSNLETNNASVDTSNEFILVKSIGDDPNVYNFGILLNSYFNYFTETDKSIEIWIEYETNIDGIVQLYYTDQEFEDFNENKSIRIPTDSEGRLKFVIPNSKYINLRLDIPNNSEFTIKNIYIK